MKIQSFSTIRSSSPELEKTEGKKAQKVSDSEVAITDESLITPNKIVWEKLTRLFEGRSKSPEGIPTPNTPPQEEPSFNHEPSRPVLEFSSPEISNEPCGIICPPEEETCAC